MICKLCGHDEFKGQQEQRKDIVVDGNDHFLRNDEDGDYHDSTSGPVYGPYTCLRCGAEYTSLEGGAQLTIGVKNKGDDQWLYVRGMLGNCFLLVREASDALCFLSTFEADQWLRLSLIDTHYLYSDIDFFVLDHQKKFEPVTFYCVRQDTTNRYLCDDRYLARTRLPANKFLNKQDAILWGQRTCGPQAGWKLLTVTRDGDGETITAQKLMEESLIAHVDACMENCIDRITPDSLLEAEPLIDSVRCGRKPPIGLEDEIKSLGLRAWLEDATSARGFDLCSIGNCPRFEQFRDSLDAA